MSPATQTKTPERELSKQLRETLRHMRSGKTAAEIAKRRKITPNAVYSAYRTLERHGYGDEVEAARMNGKPSGNGASTGTPDPSPAATATEVASGVEKALTAVASQRETLEKIVENLEADATDHETKAGELHEEARRRTAEVEVLTKMEAVAK